MKIIDDASIEDNWKLTIYDHNDKEIHSETFYSSSDITADKIALNIVETEWVGKDWTLTKIAS